ncbi:MAG: cytochrome C [Chthoniobacterales bacterium]|nr:cytochrome C [Chthoniobacterales bacterium]
MPIYEFYSADTHRIYSFYARRSVGPGVIPRCPDGGSRKMERLISPFAITGRAKEKKEGGGMPDLDPQQEAEMMRLAGEMSGMDEANPDPRQLGRLMRRMMDITGEKMPEPMLEMLARMEKGEDPEKLEEEYGAVLDEDSMASPDPEAGGEARAGISGLRRRLPPRRDPVLYEMADYI